MEYYKKYLKYKSKYFKLKGGAFEFNLEEWTEVVNNRGRQNCGIYLSTKYPNYIAKCIYSEEEIHLAI